MMKLSEYVMTKHFVLYWPVYDNLRFQYFDIFNDKLYSDSDPIKDIVNPCMLQNVYVSTKTNDLCRDNSFRDYKKLYEIVVHSIAFKL